MNTDPDTTGAHTQSPPVSEGEAVAPQEDTPDLPPLPEGEFTLGAPNLRAALEALLLVADEPMQTKLLAHITGVPEAEIVEVLEETAREYVEQGRGFELRQTAGAWRFYTHAACADVVERYVRDGQHARLTQAALETLAIVAYKQPVSRARVASIRGVSVDGVMRTLATRGLVAEVGQDEETGAHLFGTTALFLERMNLDSLAELPQIADYLPHVSDAESVLEDAE